MSKSGRPRKPAVTTGDLIAQRRLYPVAEAAELLGGFQATMCTRHRDGLITLLRSAGAPAWPRMRSSAYIRAAPARPSPHGVNGAATARAQRQVAPEPPEPGQERPTPGPASNLADDGEVEGIVSLA